MLPSSVQPEVLFGVSPDHPFEGAGVALGDGVKSIGSALVILGVDDLITNNPVFHGITNPGNPDHRHGHIVLHGQ